ncbi:LysR family transcriptional regulator [Chelatococcus reniformis]|uniref:LysR family transcriptional regulator n=2 Tax=Chelatococcus reniformis TaxID=1494448 RepID=A0A916U5S7_9HYPH|nr:LysR family transcriptional regulator [Chelatococcus reniformis]
MTRAARDLGISQPAVSKLVRKLEAHVGVKLLERNSRALRTTAEGLRLYESSQQALSALDSALEQIQGAAGAIGGVLRLHAPACLGERHLHRIVMAFQDLHPEVAVSLILDNQGGNLVDENVDLAVRMGRPAGQDLVTRKVGLVERILVASPDYLRRHGAPRSPADLGDHRLIVTDAALSDRKTLRLCTAEAPVEIPVRPSLTTNNARVLVDALRAGRGVGTTQVLLVADDLAAGRLTRVLPRYEIEATELYLAYPSSRFLRPAVRAFIDFAVPALRRIEGVT